MIKWDLILGEKAFYEFYHRYRKNNKQSRRNLRLKDIFQQHHIVVTSALLDAYEEYFFNYAMDDYDALVTDLDDIASYDDDVYVCLPVPECDGPVESQLKKMSEAECLAHPIIICDSAEQYREMARIVCDDRLFNLEAFFDGDIGNVILRNSVIFSKDMSPEDYNAFLSWLDDVFTDEKRVDIYDPYTGTARGLQVLTAVYIPRMCEETIVNLYTYIDDDLSKGDWNSLIQACGRRRVRLYVHAVARTNPIMLHDRRIYLGLSGTHITIGHGLDAMKAAGQTHVMRDCHITIDKDLDFQEQFRKNYKVDDYQYEC